MFLGSLLSLLALMIPKSCLEVFQTEIQRSATFLFFKFSLNLWLFTWPFVFTEVKLLSSVYRSTDFLGLIIYYLGLYHQMAKQSYFFPSIVMKTLEIIRCC